ncbi:unnamed protein product [Caenorhabditis brenneri]
MSPYIRLILLLPVLQGCLVVRTPKCECPVLEMSSSNIVYNVGNHSFYQNVSGYPLVEPVVKSEDCSVSMYCEGGDSLVVFDKDKVTMVGLVRIESDQIMLVYVETVQIGEIGYRIDPGQSHLLRGTKSCSLVRFLGLIRLFGAYSADGICDPRTQKWQVATDSGAAFTSFDRLFGTCVNYSPICSCPIRKISDNATAKEFLSDYDNFETYKVLQFSEPILNNKTETCNSTIPCSYKAVDKASDSIDFPYYENLSGHKAKAPEVTIDGCYVTMTCDKTYALIIMDFQNMYPTPYSSERAQCLPGRWWRLTELGPLGIFLAICVEL